MTPNIELRPAQESDRSLAQEAHHAAYREVVERQFGLWDERAQDRFFLTEWDPSKKEVIVVDGHSCGYWVVERREADFHLRELVIHPRCQGRGVGTWLLRRLQREAAATGLPVRLGTFRTNRAAVLYRRLGFEEIGSTETHVLMEWRPESSAAAAPEHSALNRKGNLLAPKHWRMVAVLVAPAPAVMVGVSVMRRGDVPTGIWLLNVVAAVVGIAISAVALALPGLVSLRRVFLRWSLLVGLVLLGATLLAPGTDGVHRWLPLGHLRIHVGAILLPPLLIALWETPWVTSAVAALTVLLVLLFQPDRAQAASFCAAWIGIGVARRERKVMAVLTVGLLIAVACLFRPDPLGPVPYVEGIVGMAASQGSILAGAGLLSIAVLPMAFVLFLERPVGVVLAVYTIGTLIAAWLGNYPVPMLGYGVSPILGYYCAVAAYALLRRPEGGPSSAVHGAHISASRSSSPQKPERTRETTAIEGVTSRAGRKVPPEDNRTAPDRFHARLRIG